MFNHRPKSFFQNPKPKQPKAPKTGNSRTRIFVGGLKQITTSRDIEEYFQYYGDVTEVEIVGKRQGNPRGFAFVTFRSPQTVKHVLKLSHKILEKEVDCTEFVPLNQKNKLDAKNKLGFENKIFVAGVPNHFEKNDLVNYFGQFGEITEVLLNSRENSCFAYVVFQNHKVAKRLIDTTHKLDFGVRLQVQKPKPKSQRNTNCPNKKKFKKKKKWKSNELKNYDRKENKSKNFPKRPKKFDMDPVRETKPNNHKSPRNRDTKKFENFVPKFAKLRQQTSLELELNGFANQGHGFAPLASPKNRILCNCPVCIRTNGQTHPVNFWEQDQESEEQNLRFNTVDFEKKADFLLRLYLGNSSFFEREDFIRNRNKKITSPVCV